MNSYSTDKHKGKQKDSGVLHILDMWHGSKNLGKRIHAVSVQTTEVSNTFSTPVFFFFFLHFLNVLFLFFRQASEGVVLSFCSGARISAVVSGSVAIWLKLMMNFS